MRLILQTNQRAKYIAVRGALQEHNRNVRNAIRGELRQLEAMIPRAEAAGDGGAVTFMQARMIELQEALLSHASL